MAYQNLLEKAKLLDCYDGGFCFCCQLGDRYEEGNSLTLYKFEKVKSFSVWHGDFSFAIQQLLWTKQRWCFHFPTRWNFLWRTHHVYFAYWKRFQCPDPLQTELQTRYFTPKTAKTVILGHLFAWKFPGIWTLENRICSCLRMAWSRRSVYLSRCCSMANVIAVEISFKDGNTPFVE